MNKYNITGKFHAHITIEGYNDGFICPKGWKNTIITLNKNNREQRDIMITRHFLHGSNKNPDFKSIEQDCNDAKLELENNGSIVTRIKLEHESLPTVDPTINNYRECHVKIKKPLNINLVLIDNFVESSNPMESHIDYSIVFINARYYSGTVDDIDIKIDNQINEFKILNPLCEVIEVKKESTIFDTNLELDRWWA